MTEEIFFGNAIISQKSKVYIIAEAGVNHNGDVSMAIELIKQAKLAGANCVKFQTFQAEEIVTRNAPKAAYQLKVTDSSESQYEMLRKLTLKFSDYKKLINVCKNEGIQFLSTPYNFSDADFLNNLEVDAFKIASGQLVELPFLKYVANLGKPMIISTGMATIGEIDSALTTIRATGNDKVVLLQCTTNYPSSIEDSNILAMESLRSAFDILVGYSDHTEENYSVYTAVALGATVIEKHFTLDKNLPGPDHSCSLDVKGFSELVHGINQITKSLGSKIKKPSAAEEKNIMGMRRSIVAKKRIEIGSYIKLEDIGFKRPATGIAPNMLGLIKGKKVLKTIESDTPIVFADIDWS